MGLYVYQAVAIVIIFGSLALKVWNALDNNRKEKKSEAPKYSFSFPLAWTLGLLDLMGTYFILTNWELVWSKVQHLFVILP